MIVYVIRHGQTNCNKNQKYNCRYDEDINECGIEQAQNATRAVKKLNLDLIICSPMKRTIHTANIINNNIPIIYDERLIERDGGILTNTLIKDYPIKQYYNYYSNDVVKGLESLTILFKRVHSFLDEIKLKYSDKNILLVTHGSVAKAIQFYFEPMPKDGILLEAKGHGNCEIKKYIIKN